MKIFHLIVLFVIVNACQSTQNISPSRIGVVALPNYMLNADVTLHDSVNYKFITLEQDFNNTFSKTKTVAATATVPDFNSQSVVAVILQPSKRVIEMAINKAEISGNEMNVYYTVTDTTSWLSYQHTPFAIATVPKKLDIKNVHFYRQNKKEKTIAVNY